jgi:glycosyltransferase involved in cell wall biosynthesis
MKIWAQTLIKNEARWLWFSVSSVINHVDKLLLWDTGSTDDSREIEKELVKKFPGKIELKERKIETGEDFTKVRQEMLDATKSDWFLIVDGDEIWFEDSIKKVIKAINVADEHTESVVVPTINLVGDIFHFQEEASGRYKFGDRVGHFGLRAIKRGIPGLHSQGGHGVWGLTDETGKMVQDRNSFKIIDAPYLHATNLRRSSKDAKVIKRAKKYRFELGETFPKDFYYPEVFFRDKPERIISPWNTMSGSFKFRAFFETPLRKIKRRVWEGKVGY